MADASDVMQLLLKTQTQMEELEADDPQISYLIAAWARMCKIIGKEFVQYLPVVMPHVLKAAQIKPEVALLDGKFRNRDSFSRCVCIVLLGWYR